MSMRIMRSIVYPERKEVFTPVFFSVCNPTSTTTSVLSHMLMFSRVNKEGFLKILAEGDDRTL